VNHSFQLESYLKERCKLVEQAMPAFLKVEGVPHRLQEAMEYSLYAGGKRLRPILLLAALEAFGGTFEQGLPAACALEMIHTYSLIHDDLPAMDNDDFRRGKPTNHKQFDEATAILAGDGLLTHAFYVLYSLVDNGISATSAMRLVKELAFYAGPRGMVGGQMADLLGENRQIELRELQFIHEHKTADLLMYSVRAGAILGGATEEQIQLVTTFGRNIGLAFQIQDDILDIYGEEEKIGKPVGSDVNNQKSTYPSLIGLENCQRELRLLIDEAKQVLKQAGIKDQVLAGIADYIVSRDR
jgi:geranylgeranyl diphosphate synthase, type II